MLRGFVGQPGLTETYQDDFPVTTICCRCGGESRHAFTVKEEFIQTAEEMVCELYSNEGKGGYWLHDVCAVAIYFCRECLEPTACYNQG
jgi:hypothetical protein